MAFVTRIPHAMQRLAAHVPKTSSSLYMSFPALKSPALSSIINKVKMEKWWDIMGSLKHQQSRMLSTHSVRKRHVIAALVVNQPGCLAQIANLFAARGYNIDSLVVGRTEVPQLSRMTVVVHGTDASVANMKRQLEDVVEVALVNILSEDTRLSEPTHEERDLILVKVSTESPEARSRVVELIALFDAKVLDVRAQQIMVQLAGKPSQIDAFIDLLKPEGIIETHRSGVIAMAKGNVRSSVSANLRDSLEGATKSIMDDSNVDATALPPG